MFLMVYPHMIPSKAPPEGTSATAAGGTAALPGATPSTTAVLPRRLGSTGEDSSPRDGRNSALGVGNVSTANAAAKAEKYMPKIFGFKINEIAKLQRWQGAMRDRQISRLEAIEQAEPST
ncbi:casein kinase 2 regulatory subunit [Tulasnella sp. 408]|nr:casein kinase 2 regulatory subunit [Tulasnella sp. 408]